MNENKQITIKCAGATSLLGVAFVVLKLCGVINWSWWWVTLPFWYVIPLAILICLILLLGFMFYCFFAK